MTFKHLYSAFYSDDCHPFDAPLQEGCQNNIQAIRKPAEMEVTDGAALIVWGGADINPALYGHPIHSTTYPGGERDKVEWALMGAAVDKGIPIIGVCRGAQMLCAKAGGFLIQNVSGHQGNHWVETYDGDVFMTNSIHHQMMAGLETVDHQLVAWSRTRLSQSYGYRDNQWYIPKPEWVEPEFVYFPKIKGYAIQWHPEGMPSETQANIFIRNFIAEKEKQHGNRAISCDC